MVSAAGPPGERVWPLTSQPFWLSGNGGGYPMAIAPCNPRGAGLMATPSTSQSAPARAMWKLRQALQLRLEWPALPVLLVGPYGWNWRPVLMMMIILQLHSQAVGRA